MVLLPAHEAVDRIEQRRVLPKFFDFLAERAGAAVFLRECRHEARQCLHGLRCQQGEILLQFLRRAALHIMQRFFRFVFAKTLRCGHFGLEALELFVCHLHFFLPWLQFIPWRQVFSAAQKLAEIENLHGGLGQFLCVLLLLRGGDGFCAHGQCAKQEHSGCGGANKIFHSNILSGGGFGAGKKQPALRIGQVQAAFGTIFPICHGILPAVPLPKYGIPAATTNDIALCCVLRPPQARYRMRTKAAAAANHDAALTP